MAPPPAMKTTVAKSSAGATPGKWRQSARATDSPLQSAIGNQRVLRSLGIFPKLKVSTPADPFEDEADRMADLVVARKVDGSSAGRCPACGDAGTCPKCRAQAKAIHRRLK